MLTRRNSDLWKKSLIQGTRQLFDIGILAEIRAANDAFERAHHQVALPDGTTVKLSPWPAGHAFALLLSHDIDQFHDRELFRVLADINHIRRMVQHGEPGSVPLATRRVLRALFRPKDPLLDFETIVEWEAERGFRSTFFVLHDPYWARYGPRFRLDDPVLQRIVDCVRSAGAEVGVHGGYYRFNSAAGYRESLDAIRERFDCEPVGIRNHLLRFHTPTTWRAFEQAGFEYDATFGYADRPGPTEGFVFPFWPDTEAVGSRAGLLELPLTLMDTTVFRYHRLTGDAAIAAARDSVSRVVSQGGLVTLLWHNNFFNEPEYEDWPRVYRYLLDWLATERPFCATGREITDWWKARAGVQLESCSDRNEANHQEIRITTRELVSGVRVVVSDPVGRVRVSTKGERLSCRRSSDHEWIVDGDLSPSRSSRIVLSGRFP